MCRKRHSKKCRSILEYKYCKFRNCAFAHIDIEIDALKEDINTMNDEIGLLNNIVKSLTTNEKESLDPSYTNALRLLNAGESNFFL